MGESGAGISYWSLVIQKLYVCVYYIYLVIQIRDIFMRRTTFILSLFIGLLWSCTTGTDHAIQQSNYALKEGAWKGVLKTQGIEVPFQFNVKHSAKGYSLELINAEDRIVLDEVMIKDDSLHVQLFIFDATIHAKMDGDKLTGVWVKNYAENYVIPFEATFGNEPRFTTESKNNPALFDGKWEVDFIKENRIGKAIGLFKQKDQIVTGTFVTSTGDYRFLEGVVDGDVMKLSCFDGSFSFLFEAKMLENGTIEGEVWSGRSRHERWTAKKNDDFELPDPYAMTYIKEGYENFELKFPNTSGELVQLSDERYKDKIVIVQILGTWCPNCMDETAFYVDWLKNNKGRGVEVIGLAFESKADASYANSRINKMKGKMGIDYEVLFAGTTSEESRAKALPMLNKVMSFPTSIILDKKHKVRKIHTGFSGPGTGEYYEKFVEEFDLMMDKLIEEQL